MNSHETILSLFSHNYSLSTIEENNAELNATYVADDLFVPSTRDLSGALSLIPSRDRFELSVTIDHQETVVISCNNLTSSLGELTIKLDIKEPEDKISLKLKISKGRSENTISVYIIDEILKFWKADGPISAFTKYESFSQGIKHAQLVDSNFEFTIGAITFSKSYSFKVDEIPDEERINVIEKRNDVTHFSDANSLNFIPDDFATGGDIPQDLSRFFEQLRFLSALVFLCDSSRFEKGKEITFRLNGYRSYITNFKDDFLFTPPLSDELYYVYKWVYFDGHIIDKIGIARNILSLHLDSETSFLTIQSGVLSSIESGFQIYLKENVHQYIEIKNKLSEFIQQASDKANGISSTFGSAFKTSIFSLYSFFASAFLIQILDKERTIVISDKLLVIFFAFIAISIFIMRESKKETAVEIKRFRDNYRRLKNRYQDLLTPLDITRILEGDLQHLSDVEYIQKKLKSYTRLWRGSLLLMFALIVFLWLLDKPAVLEAILRIGSALFCK